ncbi:hypothetical protein EMPS_11435 [Entomortierella parvispora]|uniref:N-acetyltransferase domain-containing protein n=1 Tax=Entomortierella parvispora TaxID=205924 RepID=A0A9P3M1Y2_9FUNG|nr:hypothetical protein EMPS_11435 [Entomortierella parvispora]
MVQQPPQTYVPTRFETARLSMELPTQADDAMQKTMLNDPVAMAHLQFMSKQEKGGWTLADIVNRREGHLEAVEKHRGASFIIHEKSTGEIVGTIGSSVIHYDNRNAHIGVMVRTKYWFGGYGTEVLYEYMRTLFENVKLHKVTYETLESNTGMRKFLEQGCGIPVTYILKDEILCPCTKEWVSLWVYVIFEDDWPRIKADLLNNIKRGAAQMAQCI